MSRSLGFLTARSSAIALITCPDWQKPHCGTSRATHARWTALAVRPVTPSMVVTSALPSADTGNVHERSGLPSRSTVQAPHCATPQPYLVPVKPIASRRTHSSGVSPSTSTRCVPPFTLMVKATGTSGALCCTTEATSPLGVKLAIDGFPNHSSHRLVKTDAARVLLLSGAPC